MLERISGTNRSNRHKFHIICNIDEIQHLFAHINYAHCNMGLFNPNQADVIPLRVFRLRPL